MKKLFDFRIKRTTTETKKESSKNDKGETVTVEKDVETVVSQKVVLRKPNRSLYDEAELFYGVRLSEGIKAGLLTRALLAKRFSNDGGILSEDDKNKYADLYLKLYDIQLDHDRLAQLGEKKRTKAQKAKTKYEFERTFSCISCHQSLNLAGKPRGGISGPSLVNAGNRLQANWVAIWLKNPKTFSEKSRMPVYKMDNETRLRFTQFIMTLKNENLR